VWWSGNTYDWISMLAYRTGCADWALRGRQKDLKKHLE
jgi:hypothetical protein